MQGEDGHGGNGHMVLPHPLPSAWLFPINTPTYSGPELRSDYSLAGRTVNDSPCLLFYIQIPKAEIEDFPQSGPNPPGVTVVDCLP